MPNKRKKTTIEEEINMASTEDLPQVKIAVMNNDIKHINDTMTRLEAKFDAAIQNFATNQQLIDAQTASELKHKEYEKELAELKTVVSVLKETDDKQQGSIEANQRLFSRTAIFITALAAILGALWWLPTILHR